MSEPGPKEFDDLEPLPADDASEHETLDELEPLDELDPLPAEPEPKPAPAAPKPAAPPKAEAPKPEPPQPAAKQESATAEVGESAAETALPDAPGAGAHSDGGTGGVDASAAAAASSGATAKPAGGTPPSSGAASKPAAAAPAAGQDDSGKPRKTQEERDREKAERAAQKKAELDARLGKIEGKRELEQAPLVLRKAALLLLAASMLPFGGAFTLGALLGKVLLLGAWGVFHQGHVFKAGEKAAGLVTSLAKNGMVPVFVVAGLLALAGFVAPSLVGAEAPFSVYGELASLALACFTFTHIFDYEHGGKFNPIYPLMFLAPALMGVLGILKLSEAKGAVLLLAGLGSIGIAVAGSMAVYTMFVAIKQAKIEGEQKKQAQAEARKAAREARRKQQEAKQKA